MIPEKPDHITQEDWDAVDVPEMTDAEFASARPFQEVFPAQFESWQRRGGRPKAVRPKMHVNFRLAADLVSSIKAAGRGYNARVEKVLREAVARGEL